MISHLKKLRQQLPQVHTGVDRAKSQSVDYGKPSVCVLESPLKSPPASAPLVQSARLFWNSISNNGTQIVQQQNHPIGTTQLHQQQFQRSRQRFLNNIQVDVNQPNSFAVTGCLTLQ